MYAWAVEGKKTPYGSYGNGSAMRVAAIGEEFDEVDKVIEYAVTSAAVTHNHPMGIRGAVVAAVSVYMARKGYSKPDVIRYMRKHFSLEGTKGFCIPKLEGWNMEALRKTVGYPVCQYTIPAVSICFEESDSFEDALNNSLSFNNDTDTIAAITGSIAAAYYGIPEKYKRDPH